MKDNSKIRQRHLQIKIMTLTMKVTKLFLILFGVFTTLPLFAQIDLELLKKAEAGDADAQHSVGAAYYMGEGVNKDYKKAVQWLTKSANQGDPNAQHDLAVMYMYGFGVFVDYKKAVKLYTKAANQGHFIAQYSLGLIYHGGRGKVRQDHKKAVEWFTKSANSGYAEAQHALGTIYLTGKGITPQDNKKALEWLTKAAYQGHSAAQRILAVMYKFGMGTPHDVITACAWGYIGEHTETVNECDNHLTKEQKAETLQKIEELKKSIKRLTP